MKATGIGMVTLVAYLDRNYPTERGNCFSVVTDAKSLRDTRRVVNMHHENFRELLARSIIAYPVEVVEIDEGHCAVVDERVPDDWKLGKVCTICTPHALRQEVSKYLREKTKGK
jgi:hypothetical protein